MYLKKKPKVRLSQTRAIKMKPTCPYGKMLKFHLA